MMMMMTLMMMAKIIIIVNGNEDEMDSVITETVVNHILNPVSSHIDSLSYVLGDSLVDHELKYMFFLEIMGIETSQELNYLESDMVDHSENRIVEFSHYLRKFKMNIEYHLTLNMINLKSM